MGPGRLRQRNFRAHDRLERSIPEAGRDGGENFGPFALRGVEKQHSRHRGLTRHDAAGVDFDAAAAADDDHPSAGRQKLEVLVEDLTGGGFLVLEAYGPLEDAGSDS